MSLSQLLWLNDPKLKNISQPVNVIDDSVKQLIQTMFNVIDEIQDSSLAAIQLGVPQRIIVLDMMREDGQRFREALINPEIIDQSEEKQVYTEFCSSIPDYEFPTARATAVTVSYKNSEGELKEVSAKGVFAVCLQHEIDHLNGKLISDHLSQLKLSRIKTQLTKLKKQQRH